MLTLLHIVVAALAGGVLSTLAAAATLRMQATWIPRFVSFAVGALLGAVFLELLPHALESGPAPHVMLTVLIGLLAFFLLEKLVLWRHCHEDHCETHAPEQDHHRRAPGTMIILGDTIHNALDGVLIAAAFLIDVNLGIMTGLAVLAHEVPSEVGNFAVMLHSGMSRARAFGWNLFSALGGVLGGVLGYFTLSALRPALPYALGVSAASLLYVAVADLIPGLHRRVGARDSVLQVLLIGMGVAVVATVEHLHPH